MTSPVQEKDVTPLWVSVFVAKESFSQNLPHTQVPVGQHWSCQSCKFSQAASLAFSASKLEGGLCQERWRMDGCQEDGCRVNNQGLSQLAFISYPLLNLGLIRWELYFFSYFGCFLRLISTSVFSPFICCIFRSHSLATTMATDLSPESENFQTCWWKFLWAADFGPAITNPLHYGDFICH